MKTLLNFLSASETKLPPYVIVIIAIGAAVVIGFLIFLIRHFIKHRKPPKIDESAWLLALGNKDNIVSIVAIGSRINLSLKDKEKIDREKLKELGVSSVLTMSNKITLVVENRAQEITEQIKLSLKE